MTATPELVVSLVNLTIGTTAMVSSGVFALIGVRSRQRAEYVRQLERTVAELRRQHEDCEAARSVLEREVVTLQRIALRLDPGERGR